MLSDYTALYSDLDKQYNNSISGPYHDLSDVGCVAGLQAGKITGYWRPAVITENAIDTIKRLWDVSRDIVFMDFLADGKLSVASKWLLTHGYKIENVYTHVIDIDKHKWADVRKSYQNLINRDECKVTSDIMPYKKFHCEVTGRATRPHKSWKIQQQMIERNEGFMVTNENGAAFFMCNEKWAYYASGKCNGNSHAIIYEGVLECKRRGIRYLEMGEQVFFGNEKMINISNFKRGFGGETKCRLILRST